MFMQTLWVAQLGWHELLPPELMDQWNKIYQGLPRLNGISIPRWTGQGSDSIHVTLHGFSDASMAGYAAVVYLRVASLTGQVTVSLLMSKTRVSPLKQLTIPKLELCVAALLATLLSRICTSFEFANIRAFCWTDSITVLRWITNCSSRQERFVANRVALIQMHLPKAEWHHISGKSNPADLASRGASAQELRNATLWWCGPCWLYETEEEWPLISADSSNPSGDAYETTLATAVSPNLDAHIYTRFSSWPKLLKVTAVICRWLRNPNPRTDRNSRVIDADELQSSVIRWSRVLQRIKFPQELEDLQNKRFVFAKSPLKSLNPFLDIRSSCEIIIS